MARSSGVELRLPVHEPGRPSRDEVRSDSLGRGDGGELVLPKWLVVDPVAQDEYPEEGDGARRRSRRVCARNQDSELRVECFVPRRRVVGDRAGDRLAARVRSTSPRRGERGADQGECRRDGDPPPRRRGARCARARGWWEMVVVTPMKWRNSTSTRTRPRAGRRPGRDGAEGSSTTCSEEHEQVRHGAGDERTRARKIPSVCTKSGPAGTVVVPAVSGTCSEQLLRVGDQVWLREARRCPSGPHLNGRHGRAVDHLAVDVDDGCRGGVDRDRQSVWAPALATGHRS